MNGNVGHYLFGGLLGGLIGLVVGDLVARAVEDAVYYAEVKEEAERIEGVVTEMVKVLDGPKPTPKKTKKAEMNKPSQPAAPARNNLAQLSDRKSLADLTKKYRMPDTDIDPIESLSPLADSPWKSLESRDEFGSATDIQEKTYYEGDDVLVDDSTGVPEAEHEALGEQMLFGLFKEDKDIAFVQNTKTGVLFIISRVPGSYEALFGEEKPAARQTKKRQQKKGKNVDEQSED